MSTPRYIIAGNWKMNLLLEQGQQLALDVKEQVQKTNNLNIRTVLCPPATQLAALSATVKGQAELSLGGQDCHSEIQGAFTGNLSAEMLKDAGAAYVIVGHSERRQYHQESSIMVAQKAIAAKRAGLTPIICIGETLDIRESGKTEALLASQIAESVPDAFEANDFVLAYEPVWAIGTGKVATLEIVAETHAQIAARLPQGAMILYGGSVTEENATAILQQPNVHGVLVGGASLQAARFNAIIAAASALTSTNQLQPHFK